MDATFTNWSGSVNFTPSRLLAPADESEVVRVVTTAHQRGESIRPVGAGHSSMPLVSTPDTLLSLESMAGLTATDTDAGRATMLPGTDLSDAGSLLAREGLGMENLGDVDYQKLAGAIGTGTHGTGITLGNLSQTLVGGSLVTGDGAVVPFGEDAGEDVDSDILRAAQVSLGALGVFTSMTLRVIPAYELFRLNWCAPIDWVLDNFWDLVQRNRHFDFYWYPRSDLAQVRTLNLPGEEPDIVPADAHIHAEDVGDSFDVLTNERTLRFEEMEYMVPLNDGLDTFREARARIKRRHRTRVGWRVLVRTVRGDDAMLSPAHGRDTMTIALLHNNTLPYREYFEDMEPLFQAAGGRPHWAKKHTMRAAALKPLYPEWEEFQRIRRQCDPDGVFLNTHLQQLWEEAA